MENGCFFQLEGTSLCSHITFFSCIYVYIIIICGFFATFRIHFYPSPGPFQHSFPFFCSLSTHYLQFFFTYNLRQIEIQTNNILKWFFNRFCLWSFFSLPNFHTLDYCSYAENFIFVSNDMENLKRLSWAMSVAVDVVKDSRILYQMIFNDFCIFFVVCQWQWLNSNFEQQVEPREKKTFFYEGKGAYSELVWWTFDMARRSFPELCCHLINTYLMRTDSIS